MRALWDIDRILRGVGSRLADYPELPQDVQDPGNNNSSSINTQDPAYLDQLAEHARMDIEKFNLGQLDAFSVIRDAIVDNNHAENRLFFVDGPGGTGKSFLFNTLIDYIKGRLRKQVIVVASTGIAALILRGGNTAHTTFKIPLKTHAKSVCNISHRTELAHRICRTDVIIWDEAPMQHRHNFEAVDTTIRDITKVDKPFGGKVVVFGGDFRQILPVVRRGSQAAIEDACLNSSALWDHVRVLRLTENMRVTRTDPLSQGFVEYLLRIGNGTEPTESVGQIDDCVRIPSYCVFNPSPSDDPDSSEKELIRAIYGGIGKQILTPSSLTESAILAPLNADVDKLNSLATEMLTSDQSATYFSQDSIVDEDDPAAATFTPEYLNSLNPSGIPPSTLCLKVGQPIVLLRNMNPERGMCNGTRLIVRALRKHCIQAEILTDNNFRGNMEFLFRIPLDTPEDESHPFSFRRCQFPVRPAFAMTIHKAQGQTLTHVGIYLPTPVFSHGQLYVALSRCSNPKNVKVLIKDGPDESSDGSRTRNVVYRNVLHGEEQDITEYPE
jgi:hypothetical protein